MSVSHFVRKFHHSGEVQCVLVCGTDVSLQNIRNNTLTAQRTVLLPTTTGIPGSVAVLDLTMKVEDVTPRLQPPRRTDPTGTIINTGLLLPTSPKTRQRSQI